MAELLLGYAGDLLDKEGLEGSLARTAENQVAIQRLEGLLKK